jgi:type IV secretory pathway TrbD component
MEQQILGNPMLILLLLLWVLPWKGYALWLSARKGHKVWFVALLILNTLAILEILYIFIFSRDKKIIPEKKKVLQ